MLDKYNRAGNYRTSTPVPRVKSQPHFDELDRYKINMWLNDTYDQYAPTSASARSHVQYYLTSGIFVDRTVYAIAPWEAVLSKINIGKPY